MVEEIVEITTWSQLGQHRKPIILVNIKGFWNSLLAMLDYIRSVGSSTETTSGGLLWLIVSRTSSRRFSLQPLKTVRRTGTFPWPLRRCSTNFSHDPVSC